MAASNSATAAIFASTRETLAGGRALGNVRGAMLGGLVIGLIEFFGVAYLSSEYRDVYVFSLLIGVLLLRPTGLLGKAVVEKV